MKKTLSLLLALVLCLSLCACGVEEEIKSETSNIQETSILEDESVTNAIQESSLEEVEDTPTAALGEKYSGENFEITITSFEFADLLGSDNTTRLFERDESWNSPGDGKVYMIIRFDYTCLSKQETDMTRDVEITVLYKDGYEFVSFNEEEAFLFEDDLNGTFRQCWKDDGYVIKLSPLTSDSYFIAIPVAEIVSTDNDSPLQVRINYGDNIKGGADIVETTIITIQ